MMWHFKRKVEVHVCSETDESGLAHLDRVLDQVGAELTQNGSTFAGSQEITIRTYKVEDSKLQVMMETYIGVTLSGEEGLVKKVMDKFENS